SDWMRITSTNAHLQSPTIPGERFVGTVVAIGGHVTDSPFNIGDTVAGVSEGEWNGALRARGGGCLSVRPESLCRVPAATAKEFGLVASGTGDGCYIA
ncbi:hypothetical protein FRB98_008534, partial [Tulasnella sp. 332]